VKIRVVASDLPHPQGSAAGRDLWAWCEAARALGHDLTAWIWHISPVSPRGPIPDWAEYRDTARPSRWGTFVSAADARAAGFDPEPDAVVVADHLPSGGAVVGHPRSVLTLHYRALLDALSVRTLRPWHLRTAYEEVHLARRSRCVLAFSARVARGVGRHVDVVPMTAPLPAHRLPVVEEPVAAMLADWWWKPNRAALDDLLRRWPDVRRRVPGARLLLGGRNFPADLGAVPGVEVLGTVADSTEVLAQAALLAFPCPTSSGPKGKTLEALALGLPVVTTPPGMEGIELLPGGEAMTATAADFTDRLVTILGDPVARARLADLGRASVEANHAPEVAARAKLRIFESAFGA
jgi:hypothetical protein